MSSQAWNTASMVMSMLMQQVVPDLDHLQGSRQRPGMAQALVASASMVGVDHVGRRKEDIVAPIHHGQAIVQALEEILIEVGVGVDQAGDHGAAAGVQDTPAGLGLVLANAGDAVALDQDITVPLDAVRGADQIVGSFDQQFWWRMRRHPGSQILAAQAGSLWIVG